MTRTHKIELWIAAGLALVLLGVVALLRWQGPRPISLQGAILVQNSDPHKQQPVGGVTVSAGGLALADTTSDASGHFTLHLHAIIRHGHPIILTFKSPQYKPLEVKDFVANKLYIVHLVPLAAAPVASNQPMVKVTNVRVRYTVKAMTEVNVGSAVKTFDVQNKGNVPCDGQHPCSPDGRWRANTSAASLDAGAGNVFRDARASCIAGPCPFTNIQADYISHGGQVINVSALDWSDSATFLLEAEVFHPMMSQIEHWSYPVIFGETLSFTLPATAESVSIQADLDGQTIIFPLGPSVILSWASCDAATNPDKGRIYRCTPKQGYRFQ
jgi:hypothetical protein